MTRNHETVFVKSGDSKESFRSKNRQKSPILSFGLIIRPLVSQTRHQPFLLHVSRSGVSNFTPRNYIRKFHRSVDIRGARVQPGGKLTRVHKNRFDILPCGDLTRKQSWTEYSKREASQATNRFRALHVRLQINVRADLARRFPRTYNTRFLLRGSPASLQRIACIHSCEHAQTFLPPLRVYTGCAETSCIIAHGLADSVIIREIVFPIRLYF